MKVYIDHSSQPSRAVLCFCLINKIPCEIVEKRVIKADVRYLLFQHLTQEFTKISPLQLFPTIQDGHAILKYLAMKYKTPQHWYPQKQLQKVAKIDEYLNFHHTNTRNCARLTFNKGFADLIGDRKYNFKTDKVSNEKPNFQLLQSRVKNALEKIENYYLGKTKYIANDQISIADLSAYCQLKQMEYIKYDFSAYPNICRWQKRIQQIPEINQAHKKFKNIVKLVHQKTSNRLPKL